MRIYKGFDDSDPESVRAGDHVTVLTVKVRTATAVELKLPRTYEKCP